MKKKWLGITLALLVVVVAAVAAVITIGDTKAEAADYPIQISVDSVEIPYGEKIVVNFSGMLKSLYYNESSGKWHDIELRLVSGHGLTDAQMTASRWDYTDLTNNYSADTQQDTSVVITESGVRTFPDDGYGTGKGSVQPIALNPGQYSLAVYDYSANAVRVSNLIEVTVCAVEISVEKTDFYLGEPIKITYSGLSKDMYMDGMTNDEIELRLDAGHDLHDDRTGVSATGCIEMTYYSASEEAYRGESGLVAFGIDDNANRGGSTKVYPVGKYTIWAFDYKNDDGDATDARTPVSNRIEITIHKTTISTEKTVYKVGEPIKVTYHGLTESLATEDLEMRIDNQNLENYASGKSSLGYVDMVYDNDGTTLIWRGESATVTFPDDDARVIYNNNPQWPLKPGKYTLWIMDYNPRIAISNAVEFVVEELDDPILTLNDDDAKFVYGESISLTYSGIDELFMVGNQAWVSIAVMAENAVIGKTGSLAEHVVWGDPKHTSAECSEKSEGTISFPADDNGRLGVNFPLPVGKYYIGFRVTNTGYESTFIEFEVVAPTASIQPELKDSIAMHYTVEYGNNLTGDASMEFTFNDTTVSVEGTPVTASKAGMTAYTFTFDNILPQQMGDDLVAKMIVGDKVVRTFDAYSLSMYATKKLASDKAEDVAAHDIIVAMLNYGAEAQLYFDYKTDALVNDSLSEAQKDLPSIKEIDAVAAAVSGTKVDGYAWKAATLDLQSTLAFRLKFEAADINSVVITDGQKSWSLATNPECFLQGAGNTWYFYYKNIMAHQFGKTFEITMVVDDLTAQTVAYSVNTYISYIGSKDTSTVDTICQALYAFGLEASKYSA